MMGLAASNIGSIVTTGLLFHFNNAYGSYPGTGTTVTDQSAAANNATLGSAVTYSTANGGTFILAGAVNNFIQLNTAWTAGQAGGPNGSVNATTQCIWVKTTATSGARLIGCQNTAVGVTATNYSNFMWIGTNGLLYGGTFPYTSPAAVNAISSGVAINNGAWRYCCYVRSIGVGSTVLYVDGVAVASSSPTVQNEQFAARVSIGAGYNDPTSWPNQGNRGAGYLNCSIGAVQYYNIALTADQIRQNFNAQRGRYGI